MEDGMSNEYDNPPTTRWRRCGCEYRTSDDWMPSAAEASWRLHCIKGSVFCDAAGWAVFIIGSLLEARVDKLMFLHSQGGRFWGSSSYQLSCWSRWRWSLFEILQQSTNHGRRCFKSTVFGEGDRREAEQRLVDLILQHGKNWTVFLDFISTVTIIINLVAMASASDSEDELCLLYELIELETTIRMVVSMSLSILV